MLNTLNVLQTLRHLFFVIKTMSIFFLKIEVIFLYIYDIIYIYIIHTHTHMCVCVCVSSLLHAVRFFVLDRIRVNP